MVVQRGFIEMRLYFFIRYGGSPIRLSALLLADLTPPPSLVII